MKREVFQGAGPSAPAVPSPIASAQARRERLRILAICSMSLLIMGLDVTAVNVALPSIQADLGATVSGLQWTIDAYTVVLASFLMLAGSVADRLGRRRVLIAGLSLFTAASVLCSLAPSIEALVAARLLQAIGASMMNPVAMSIVTNTFLDPRERAQAIGIWGAMFGVSMAIGPIVGGTLVALIDWRAIFWINLPVGILAASLVVRYVPESRAPRARRPDPIGQLLMILFLAGTTFAIIEAPAHALGTPVLLAAAAAVAGLLGLLAYEPRRDEPLLDLRFFGSVPFASAVSTAIATFSGFSAFLFLSALDLQQVRGLSALEAGAMLMPLALTMATLSPLSGRLLGRIGPRVPLVAAGVTGTAGALLMLLLPADAPLGGLLVAYVLIGVGLGFVNAPITNAAVSGMPRAQAGVASAIASTSRQVGVTLGVAIGGAIVAASSAPLAGAIHAAWAFVLGTQVAVLILAFVATSRRAARTAERTAAKLNPEALARTTA